MKLHFESNLDYQQQAIDAICDLFRGQEICRTEFTVSKVTNSDLNLFGNASARFDLGIGNRLQLLDTELLRNLQEIQLRNGLPVDDSLRSGDFTVEMETGTGKTYVYLRTLFELHKRYGFTKFVVVVPSVAIKEGVFKTLQITEEHFTHLYDGVPYEYFQYDSSKLGQVRNFATSPHIQIMLATVGAINKRDINNLYQDSEKTGGEKPIDLVSATRPVLIVDEPQSVDGGLEGRGREALGRMNPLCTLRYSATHADKHHMVYKLDAVDAYERQLVKQIEVASATLEGDHNKAYARLIKVVARPKLHAVLELDVLQGQMVKRKEIKVTGGEALELLTKRDLYNGFTIGEINAVKGASFVEVRTPQETLYLREGQTMGAVEDESLQRLMMRRTIREHLDKEKKLRPQGIKVLSLFFIDSVEKYRAYDDNGNMVPGRYAQIFEEEYARLVKHPHYNELFQQVDAHTDASSVHNGYFSIDKKKINNKTVEVFKDSNGCTKADDDTYQLIMRDKERLLDLATPLKFIFSHSALREGWDNPNVFQICNLRDMRTERERRQTIGRGLRLCVNQQGERLRGFSINTLTVIANESYEAFAENLQKEIEESTGIRFGVVESHQFASVRVEGGPGSSTALGMQGSQSLFAFLQERKYLDGKGRIQDSLRKALLENNLDLPPELQGQASQIQEILRKQAGRLAIRNADERKTIAVRKEILLDPDFRELWERIKHKTTYRVHFDNEKLIKDASREIREGAPVSCTTLQWRTADLAIGRGGVEAQEQRGAQLEAVEDTGIVLPDLITDLQDKTQLTRQSIVRILQESGRLQDFVKNPQQFIELAASSILRMKRLALVDGIKYHRIGDGAYYAQELIEQEELTGYVRNLFDARKAVHESVVYDAEGTERNFAQDLECNDAVKLYMKLPGWFKVPTPLGSYNPDWALLVEKDGSEKLYFVVETKSTHAQSELHLSEAGKIRCGQAHFEALAAEGGWEQPAQYVKAVSVRDVLAGYGACGELTPHCYMGR